MSQRASAGRPAACSGDMYSGVPIAMPGLVSRRSRAASASVVFAMPKSSTLTTSAAPSRVIRKTFSGFRSRWTMPCACAAASARQIWLAIRSARAVSTAPSRSMMFPSSTPSRYSITKYTLPSLVVPESVTSTMFGCPIFEAARASRRNRSTRSGMRL